MLYTSLAADNELMTMSTRGEQLLPVVTMGVALLNGVVDGRRGGGNNSSTTANPTMMQLDMKRASRFR
jgi:hypothetical protein